MAAAKMLRVLGTAGLALGLLVGGVACSSSGSKNSGKDASSGGSSSAAPVTTINLGYAGATLAPSAGLYTSIPDKLGFWAKENVKVNVVRVEGTAAALAALVAGKVDIAVIGGDPTIQAAGKGTPVVMPYVLSTKGITVTLVPNSSSVKTFADLQGKTVGVPTLASSAVQFTKAAVSQAGGNPDKVTFVAVGTGPAAAALLQANKVDAVTDTDSAQPVYEKAVPNLREIKTPLNDQLRASAVAATTRDFITKNPAAVAGWAKGVAEATVWANANPDAAVKVHYEVFPNEKPIDGDTSLALAQLKARLARSIPEKGELYGDVTDAQWTTIVDLLVQLGTIDSKVPTSKFWDGSLIKKINDFDQDKIKKTKAP